MSRETKKKKEIRMPHTYVIIFCVILFCWLLTFLVPVGKYDTHKVEWQTEEGKTKSKTVLKTETFRYQYDLDESKLKTNLEVLIKDDAKLKDAGLEKGTVQELLKTDVTQWDENKLDEAGLTEPVIYALYNDSVYDTSSKATKHANIWGTEDFYGFGVLNYVFEGLVTGDKWGSAVGIVAFILVIGGAFGIVMRTGAVDAGIHSFINVTKGKESLALPLLFILFSLGGAVFGMSEETIPFAMIVIPFVVAMGYDSLVGVSITFVASQVGNATSWMNPFGIAIAQGIAGVPVLSGAGFRIGLWIIGTAAGVAYLMAYANKIKKNPQCSMVYETDNYFRKNVGEQSKKVEFNLGHKLVLLTILGVIIWIVWGVTQKEFYIPEIASQFFVMGLVSGIIGVIFNLNDMRINDIGSSFQSGAADLVGAAIVVGMAKGILLVLGGSTATEFNTLNTILHGAGNALSQLPSAVSAVFMYVFQTVFNFFVPSGSGQAALTMPILAPLSDLVGVSRQVSCLAYQLGAGFADAIIPTSASLMGVLGVARIEWTKWAKWQIKMQGFFFVFGTISIIVAVLINF
ncbi:putative basic amino acid antiporter YfcC [Clostridium sp.]|uniref:putative basic amino acid antiporter YfcC n=1 Tax=Clostridium sp. TaxID=1506 RepID=UPI002FC75B2B